MKSLSLRRYALSISAAAALLSGCGGSQQPVGAPGAMLQSLTSSYGVLYRFGGRPDGERPEGTLLNVNGTLYGTTYEGGRACNKRGGPGCGTVYSIDMNGTEKVLYRFHGESDGTGPLAGLIDVNGMLYGSASAGGAYNRGTIFSITTGGVEKVLHSFGQGTDGRYPGRDLVDVSGTLYGTTTGGGKYRYGTVYSIDTNGTEKVVYSFRGGSADGLEPEAGLIDVKGRLYGTTAFGGGSGCASRAGCGTVYSVTTTGKEMVLYSFKGGSDGERPQSEVIDVNGTLYGTTYYGGNSVCPYAGCGTVYSVTTSGKEKVLYRFSAGSDGGIPAAALIDVKGTLYGTTELGGSQCYSSGGRCGTVFSVTTGGAETVLHRFAGGSDGMFPLAPLIGVNGTLYGTTAYGGNQGQCCGTVFALRP